MRKYREREKEQEMRGYTQTEGQSAQGSDKQTLCTCIYILEECK